MTNKKLDLTKELKKDLSDLAWQRRISMSEYVAGVVQEIADGKVVVTEATPVRHDTSIKYEAPEGYDRAMKLARAAGRPLAEIVRDEIARRAA